MNALIKANENNKFCITTDLNDDIYKFITSSGAKGTPELYDSMKNNFPVDKNSYSKHMHDYANTFIQQSHSVSKDGYAINQSYQFLQYVITDYDNHLYLETGNSKQRYIDLGSVDDFVPSEYIFPPSIVSLIDSIQ